MRRLLLLPVLLLSSCLDYEVRVETTVADDGSFSRTVFFREKSNDHRTWSTFSRPGAAYGLAGSDAEGFTATTKGGPGVSPSGLRVVLDDSGAHVEGEVLVEVDDLIVGRLYRYRERLATGVDPALVRAEIEDLLDVLLDHAVRVLEEMEPDVDFFPVFEVAHERVFPRLEASLLIVQQALAGLARDHREHLLRRPGSPPGDGAIRVEIGDVRSDWADVAEDPRFRLCLAELARFGLVRREDGGPVASLDDLIEDEAWTFEPFVLDELLRPVSDLSHGERAALIGRVLHEKEFGDLWDRLWKERHPEDAPETRAMEVLGARVAAGACGALFARAFADHHDLRFRVELPGTVLFANGELGGLPAVEWQLDGGDCAFQDPVLTAWSFAPREGLPARGWSLSELEELRRRLERLDAEGRAAVARAFASPEGDVELDAAQREALELVARMKEHALRGG